MKDFASADVRKSGTYVKCGKLSGKSSILPYRTSSLGSLSLNYRRTSPLRSGSLAGVLSLFFLVEAGALSDHVLLRYHCCRSGMAN
jgi:hypothetical protein